MVVITVENYMKAGVHAITVLNEQLFWVRMHDVQDGLYMKKMSNLTRKEIQDIFETECPTKEQIKKYKRSETEIDEKNVHASFLNEYARSDIMVKIIKNCKGVKRWNDGINRTNKEEKEMILELF